MKRALISGNEDLLGVAKFDEAQPRYKYPSRGRTQGILVSEDEINGGDPLGPANPFLVMPGTLHPFVSIYTYDAKSGLKPPIKNK